MTVNSADSHVLEPSDLWLKNTPAKYRDRTLRVERDGDREAISIDGVVIRRNPVDTSGKVRAPGQGDPVARLHDLESQDVWAELMFPSLGLWLPMCPDRALSLELSRVYNDWLLDSFMSVSPRYIGAAIIPIVDIVDAVSEIERAAGLGFQAVNLPAHAPDDRLYNDPVYEPVWSAIESTGVRMTSHVGTGADPVVARGRGGAVINYTETFFPPQRLIAHLVASGVLDAHPRMHVIVVEGGASWLPALMERMDEGYTQHGMWARPKLSALPSEIIRRQVHATFQHDRALLSTIDVTGVESLLWGSDYPHFEGTWPNTQHELDVIFDGSEPGLRQAITGGNFAKLFAVPDAA